MWGGGGEESPAQAEIFTFWAIQTPCERCWESFLSPTRFDLPIGAFSGQTAAFGRRSDFFEIRYPTQIS